MLIRMLLICLVVVETVYGATPAEFRGGSHVSGPKLDTADLTGRIVLVEYWGVHCPPCLASIPHISALQDKHGRDQFVIIANQVQGADDAEAKSVFKARSGSDLVTVVNHGGLPGVSVSAIPHCLLYSHDGKLIYEGSPFDVDAHVEAALKNSPGFLVAGHTFTKMTKQATAIGAMKGNLSATLKSLRVAAESDDAVAKSEADHLLGKVAGYSERSWQKLTALRDHDAIATVELLSSMVGLLAGDDLGKPYEALVKDLKNDKHFQAELKAGALLADVTELAGKIGLVDRPDEAKRNRQAMSRIVDDLRTLVKRFPGTKAAAQAGDLARKWGI